MRLLVTTCLLVVSAVALGITLPGSKSPLANAEAKGEQSSPSVRGNNKPLPVTSQSEEKTALRPPDHPRSMRSGKINCKVCHDCEYPTKQKPCLVTCPKTESSIYHSASEAPEVLVLDELKDRYGSVVFSHRLHAQMSEISIGCTGCHHYNTTGPVLNCKKCHERGRIRENLSIPDLSSAYHRQCLPCHRQWGRSTECETCHMVNTLGNGKKLRQATKRLKGKSHPQLPKPNRVVYETRYEGGKLVTFYHDEHITLFKQACVSCHKGDNCTKCHDVQKKQHVEPNGGRHLKVHRSFQEHHRACAACHAKDACSVCHGSSEKKRFNHAVNVGWPLKKYHTNLPCSRCHEIRATFNKPDKTCRSCHKNWKTGTFKHRVTGLELSANHLELECGGCHKEGDFTKKPVCAECHGDKEYPRDLPGKRVSGKKTS